MKSMDFKNDLFHCWNMTNKQIFFFCYFLATLSSFLFVRNDCNMTKIKFMIKILII